MSWIETRPHFDAAERKFVFERWQDCEPIVENNKAFQNAGKQTGDFRLVASIPNVVLEKWINEDGVNYLALPKGEFERLIRRKINDPDWAWLRAGGGRL
jgi:hypothetical protein